MKIDYSHEPEILGTAGAIGKAAPMLGAEPYLVLNGDMLLDAPLQLLLEQHIRTDADVTLIITPSEPFPHYSGLHFDDSLNPPRLVGIPVPGSASSSPGRRYHYCGVQIVNSRIAAMIPSGVKTDIFRDIYPRFMEENARIFGFLYDGFWMEVGALREYLATSLALQKDPLPEHLQPPGANGLIDPAAVLESEARVTDSVVLENARIQSGVSVDHSIIGRDVVVTKSVRNVALARGILPWYIR
jgi:NDP-sugar pyrophosphorylase family protein